MAPVNYSFAITHHIDRKNNEIDVEVQFPIEKLQQDEGEIHFKEVSECLAATVAFQGMYTQISEVMRYIGKWIAENGYEKIGTPFSIYYRSPGNEKDAAQFITEICFPIKKLKK